MKSRILAVWAFGFLGASLAGAQSTKAFRSTKPLRSASLDLATGSVTRGPSLGRSSAATISDFPNLDLGGFVGVDTGLGFCEWFDAGVKGTSGNASDLMTNFVFAYCSSALDANSGGSGGSVTLGFYEGYTVGGPPTPAVASFSLTGLPANSVFVSCPFVGTLYSCFYLDATLPVLIPFADGPIGYSWKFLGDDVCIGGAATVPFLACVQSCSGPGPDGLGMIDVIDQYCPPGTLRSQISFGTTPYGSYFTSMSMDIREVSDCTASVVPYDSTSPPNADVLTAAPAIVGEAWTAEVTHAAGTATFSTLLVRGSKLPGNGAPAGAFGRLLVTGAYYANVSGNADALPPIQADQMSYTAAIPASFSLACIDWFAQALTGGSGATRLSNGIDGDTGTQ